MSIVKKKLMIEGMHCNACAMNIDFDLEDLDGVIAAKTHYAKGECEVQYDDQKVTMEEVIRQIEKTGYKVFYKQ